MLAREVISTHKSCDIIVCSSHTQIPMAYISAMIQCSPVYAAFSPTQ